MDVNLDELESSPTTPRKSGRGGLLVFLIGIAIGVAGTLLLPRYVMPLLPESLRGGGEQVDGVVLAMGRDGDKLLVTVDTQKGAVLSTFTRRVAEVELLVRVGDTLTLGMERYAPFVDDPTIAAVRKDRSRAAGPGGSTASADTSGESAAGMATDDVAEGGAGDTAAMRAGDTAAMRAGEAGSDDSTGMPPGAAGDTAAAGTPEAGVVTD